MCEVPLVDKQIAERLGVRIFRRSRVLFCTRGTASMCALQEAARLHFVWCCVGAQRSHIAVNVRLQVGFHHLLPLHPLLLAEWNARCSVEWSAKSAQELAGGFQ